MNFKADDYLVHHGVKGMRWRKHKYKLVKGADGKYTYVYDGAQTARQARAEKKDKDVGKMSREYLNLKRSITGNKPLAETRYKKMGPVKQAPGESERKVKKVTYTGVPGELKQAYEKLVSTENKSKIERSKRIRLAEEKDKQIKDRNNKKDAQKASYPSSVKRTQEAAAESTARHKAAVNAQKYKEHTARTEEATARRNAAASKDAAGRRVQQYLIKRTQEAAAIKRKKADEWRKADPSIESLGYSSNPFDTRAIAAYDRGDRSTDGRYSKGRTSGGGVLPSEETRKRLRRNKRKKTVADVKRFINRLINK